MIGDNIKRIREERGMSQLELSRKLSVSDKTISSWETNRTEPKIAMIEQLCIALNCQKSEIVGEDKSNRLSPHEKKLLYAYRQNKEMQKAVNKLLDI